MGEDSLADSSWRRRIQIPRRGGSNWAERAARRFLDVKIMRASILFSFAAHAALVGSGWWLWTGPPDGRDASSMLISIRDEPAGVPDALPESSEPPRPQDPVEAPAQLPEEMVAPTDGPFVEPERARVERGPFELRLNARLATPLEDRRM